LIVGDCFWLLAQIQFSWTKFEIVKNVFKINPGKGKKMNQPFEK